MIADRVHIEFPRPRQMELDELHIDTERVFPLSVGEGWPLGLLDGGLLAAVRMEDVDGEVCQATGYAETAHGYCWLRYVPVEEGWLGIVSRKLRLVISGGEGLE